MECPKCHSANPETLKFCGECGTQLIPPTGIKPPLTETLEVRQEALATGSTFAGRYQIIEELGKGGMGRVYRALDKTLSEEVAIKLIKPEIALDKDTLTRFQNELKIARKISHRNVGRMYELMQDQGLHFITMEYVPGEDLRSFLHRSKRLAIGTAVAIAAEVCEGLAEAHRLGVVHRDLKPSNIIIDKDGNARIMDFGIARSLRTKSITGEGVIIGTPEYMSPEQVEGKEVDPRSDLYSLGAILYEMITGRVPFEGETPLSVAVKQKTEPAPDPRKWNAQVPDGLSHIVLKCLEKDRAKRYQNASELRADLEKLEKELPTTTMAAAKPKGFTSKQITVTLGVRRLFIPALVFLVVVVAGLILWRVLSKTRAAPPPADKPSLAVMYFKNNTGDEGLDHWRAAISDLVVTDLSQSKYIKILSSDRLFNILSELDQAEAKSYTSKTLKDVAERGGVKDVLAGSFAKAGDNFRIDVTLQDARTGELLASERVEGKGEDAIFSMVDELTRKIKADLKLSSREIASDVDREIKNITTSSPEAFKLYGQGRELHYEQKYRESIGFMEKAVAIDPDFAMAYRSMAMSFANLFYTSEKKRCLQKAFELSDRLSDRERYIIQADYYRESERHYDKAIKAYEKLLELYPDESMGITNLGILYNSLEEWDKAIELYERRMRSNPDDIWPYFNIMDSYLAKGWPAKAQAALEGYLRNYKDNFMVRLYLSFAEFIQGRPEQALAEAEKVQLLSPGFYMGSIANGCIYRALGDWGKGEAEYRKAAETKETAGQLMALRMLGAMEQLRGQFNRADEEMSRGLELAGKIDDKGWISDFHENRAYVFLGSGRPEKALEEAKKSLDLAVEIDSLSRQRLALLAKGYAEVELEKIGDAQKTADALRALTDQDPNRKNVRYLDLLEGKILLSKGDNIGAVDRLAKAEALLPFEYGFGDNHALFMDALAGAYFESGDLGKAKAEYEKITRLVVGAFYYGDTYARSFYRLGMICEKQGDAASAAENYRKFLDLWKEADPGRPEVRDAGNRLSGLTAG